MCKNVEITPENALQRLPEAFYASFAGELVSVFGIDIFNSEDNICGVMGIEHVIGSCGWHAALKAVCKRLEVEWFYEWYDALDWMKSDEFDCDLVKRLKAHVTNQDEESRHAYYKWLIRHST